LAVGVNNVAVRSGVLNGLPVCITIFSALQCSVPLLQTVDSENQKPVCHWALKNTVINLALSIM